MACAVERGGQHYLGGSQLLSELSCAEQLLAPRHLPCPTPAASPSHVNQRQAEGCGFTGMPAAPWLDLTLEHKTTAGWLKAFFLLLQEWS